MTSDEVKEIPDNPTNRTPKLGQSYTMDEGDTDELYEYQVLVRQLERF